MAIFTPKENGWKFAHEWRIGGNLLTKEEQVAICSLKKEEWVANFTPKKNKWQFAH